MSEGMWRGYKTHRAAASWRPPALVPILSNDGTVCSLPSSIKVTLVPILSNDGTVCLLPSSIKVSYVLMEY